MEHLCQKCGSAWLKSDGKTTRLFSKSVRWIGDSAVLKCNICRAFIEVPLELKFEGEKVVVEVGNSIKKSVKEKLVVHVDAKKHEKTPSKS